MSASVNKVILVGRVGKDPEIRATQAGKEIASFSLATSETWKEKGSGERKEKTEWHNVVVFNDGLVNVVKSYVTKGMLLYIEGALATRKWVDKEGKDRYSTEVVLQGFGGTLTMLSSPSDRTDDAGDSPRPQPEKASPATELFADDVDSIPF